LNVFIGEWGDDVGICEEKVVRNEESCAETCPVAVNSKKTDAIVGKHL
jgi:hypothetical protein